MRKGIIALILAVFLGVCGGCTTSPGYYMQDRVLDFVDIFGVRWVAGKGVKIGFEVGNSYLSTEYEDFLIPGLRRHILPPAPVFGYYDFEKFGFQSRAAGVWRDKGVDLFGPVDRRIHAVQGNDYLFESVDEFVDWYRVAPDRASSVPIDYRQPKYHSVGDVHLYFAFFFGMEADFSPWQMADFLLGWFHIDVVKDDRWNRFYKEEFEEDVVPPPNSSSDS